ncbi:hypothetical protein E1B28_003796 [Marasmius oreades]|uniref:Uncharacterized protein n=1 Tax=Marasmius oreades TaxID=181124 RepID=A0A9P7UXA6_9AGAR|nr:uncharacterized protein E1B28_003796 [Marasmius oreades]KAG7096352.1 hypothetical protein E1B28_003796 [Marasmius oreades]
MTTCVLPIVSMDEQVNVAVVRLSSTTEGFGIGKYEARDYRERLLKHVGERFIQTVSQTGPEAGLKAWQEFQQFSQTQ